MLFLFTLSLYFGEKRYTLLISQQYLFTFMHLADAFIQSDLQLHSGYTFSLVRVPWESNPQPFAQLTQCSTTEPQRNTRVFLLRKWSLLHKKSIGATLLVKNVDSNSIKLKNQQLSTHLTKLIELSKTRLDFWAKSILDQLPFLCNLWF